MSQFDLPQAIAAWRDALLKAHFISPEDAHELTDHLTCDIEERVQQGQSEQHAFICAADAMKTHPLLKDSAKRECGLFHRLIELECGKASTRTPASYARAKQSVIQSILWASAMLGSAILMGDHPQSGTALLLVFIPLSVASIYLTRNNISKKEA